MLLVLLENQFGLRNTLNDSNMKNVIITAIIFSSMTLISLGQDIQEIEIKSVQSNQLNVCLSDCEECGIIIFTTKIPDLSFESNMNYVKDVKVTIEETKYIYSVVAMARPEQRIIIKGPDIVNYSLIIKDLEPAHCQDFYINIIGARNEVAESELEPKDTESASAIQQDGAQESTQNNNQAVRNLQQDIQKHKKNQIIWLGGAVLSAGLGVYTMQSADQKYEEYLGSTDPDELADLQETVELYDKLTPVFFGIAGICAAVFTVQTIKKGKKKNDLRKRKNDLQVTLNAQGIGLAYKF